MYKKMILILISMIIISASSLIAFACNNETITHRGSMTPHSSGNVVKNSAGGHGSDEIKKNKGANLYVNNKAPKRSDPTSIPTKVVSDFEGGSTDSENKPITPSTVTDKDTETVEGTDETTDETTDESTDESTDETTDEGTDETVTETSAAESVESSDPSNKLPKTGESNNINFMIFGGILIAVPLAFLVIKKKQF
jgi:LPXTG-motif cell wall-anchored protein